MTETILYDLTLPATRTGERLAKTVGRILKHVYSAEHLRVQHSKDTLIVSARVDRIHLQAIRGAVQMAMQARGIKGVLNRDASQEPSATKIDGSGRAQPQGSLQEKQIPASDDAPTAA